MPGGWTEPARAASIVFIGVGNLVRDGAEPFGRVALRLEFGQVHGFGFASVLREPGIGQGDAGIGLSRISFNLGVELGRVAVAAGALPAIWRL